MKLRVFEKSIRLRLSDDECRQLASTGRVDRRLVLDAEESHSFAYSVETSSASGAALDFREGRLRVTVAAGEAEILASGLKDAIEAVHSTPGGGSIAILIERDYAQ
ncbi:MAG: hypothetical protein FJY88_13155 [Candidatus Eisenbacteria bacterium]|nr:hypothetical protein [Candidatus Eisenbacteria bacterium]